MRRIGQAAGGVSIARQQITEFVVNGWHGNVQDGKQRGADADGKQKDGQAGQQRSRGEAHR